MVQQQDLVGRLVNQQLLSLQALRQLGSSFADEISRQLRQHDEQMQQFVVSQRSLNEARATL